MGDYRIVIEGVGGHGCDRIAKEGETLAGPCERAHCPDCSVRRLVSALMANGNSVKLATLTHWPRNLEHPNAPDYAGPGNHIVDDLVSGVRKSGAFGGTQ